MPMSAYFRRLRDCVGHDLLMSPAAAACIRDPQDRILLLRRSDGENVWSFPGGAIEPGEPAGRAVVREALEETGLHIEPAGLIGVYTDPDYIFAYPNGDRVQPIVIFLECRITGGKLRPDMDEIVDAQYFGPGDVLPPLLPCCAAKARDAFAFEGRSFCR
jgi:8-oxo-dGTP pyrophosphatase MutT (NUDIX family)